MIAPYPVALGSGTKTTVRRECIIRVYANDSGNYVDVSGVVVEVGPSMAAFKPGHRVLGCVLGRQNVITSANPEY